MLSPKTDHLAFRHDLHDKLITNARALRPLLESKAAIHEEQGELSPEVVAALDEMGAFRMAAPTRCNGLAVSSTTMALVAAEIAKGCPSTAWVMSIINSNAWLASTTPSAMQAVVFQSGSPRICSPQNGIGKLTRTDAGYSLTGKWAYGSGSHHADLVLVPALTEDGTPNLVILPIGAVKVEPTWRVAGMKGTGSDTVVADNVMVPLDCCCAMAGVSSRDVAADIDSPKEATDYWVAFPLLRAKSIGVLLGCAEGLLESVVALKDRPYIYTTYKRRGDAQVFQAGIGEAAAKIRAARLLMCSATDRNDLAALSGQELSNADRADFRGEATIVLELLSSAVEQLMNLAGSSAFSSSHPAQRFWRDFSIASRHIIFNGEISNVVYGRMILGLDPEVVTPESI